MPNQAAGRRFQTSPAEQRVLIDKIDGFVVSQVKDVRHFWRMECNCQGFHKAREGLAKWCDHAQQAIKMHKDVELPENVPGVDGGMLDSKVRVTVIINPALEAWYELDDPDENDFRAVRLVVPDMSAAAESPRYFAKKPMGLLHANSGRLELRTLTLEWLIGLTSEGRQCRAAHHMPDKSPYERQEEFITSRGNPGFPVLVDFFDLETTGNCRACNENSGVPEL